MSGEPTHRLQQSEDKGIQGDLKAGEALPELDSRLFLETDNYSESRGMIVVDDISCESQL